MAEEKLKSIQDLINSTNSIQGYGSESLGKKKFGSIFAFNKVVKPSGSSNVEVSMMISGVTDMVRAGKIKRPVAAHKVDIVIKGIKRKNFSAKELVEYIRRNNNTYADEEQYTDKEILSRVEKQQDSLVADKTIFSTRNPDVYVVLDNEISPDCKIKVHCSCSSYYWSFQWYNCDNNVDILGKYPENYTYVNGKKASTRRTTLRNPRRAYGMCKHVLLLLGMLMDEGLVKNATVGENSPAMSYRLNVSRFKKEMHLSRAKYEDLVKKFKSDQKRKTVQRRQLIYGPKASTTAKKKNFAMKNNKNIPNTVKGKKKRK